ncbi:hypothetical protein PYCC9005_003462 [Savitreella phatthalungensis]
MVLRQFLTQFGAKYVHDALVQSPAFHRLVQKTHDAVKGVPKQHRQHLQRHQNFMSRLEDDEQTVSRKMRDFAGLFRDEFIDNFSKKKR